MSGKVYGPLRLPQSAPVRTQYPTVSRIPSASAPTPRRRRTIVCSNLTVKGETWTVEDARLLMKDVLKGDKVEIKCDARPGVTLKADYAQDVCMSSWCRGCPFAAGNQEAVA